VIFVGTVNKGKIEYDLPANLNRWLMTLEGKRVSVEVKKFYKTRTTEQNSYWWGVVVDTLSKHTGFESDEMHDWLKLEFLPVYSSDGKMKSGRSTTRLTTLEFVDLIERVQRWAAQDLQCYIPDPNE